MPSNLDNESRIYIQEKEQALMQSHETIQVTIVKSSLIQSSLPIPPFLGLAKKRRFSETAVLGGSITFKWAAVLGGTILHLTQNTVLVPVALFSYFEQSLPQILQGKITRLEHLLQLKDLRIEDLDMKLKNTMGGPPRR